ncbi:zinc-binding dehydrogenase [Acidobacteria bacterium AB60]|nr:zinc-binding dehydrogenase [Acidobacteria bacterium AB60]
MIADSDRSGFALNLKLTNIIQSLFRCPYFGAGRIPIETGGRVKAVIFDEVGLPTEVLKLAEVEIREMGDDDVLVRMLASPINPGDFLFIQDLYPEPKKPRFPRQIGGNYGAGIVEKAGKNTTLDRGALVFVTYYDTWSEYAVAPARWLIPLASGYPIQKAAQFMNLITGWDLLEESGVQPGQWLLLTAGNSSIATIVSQFAARRGVKVISVVRTARGDMDMAAFGVTQLIDLSKSGTNLGELIADLTHGLGTNAVIDCVGGALFGDLVRLLAMGGQAIVYGGYREDRFELHNFDLLMKGAAIRSYIYRYFFSPPRREDLSLLQRIAESAQPEEFRMPIGGTHGLDDFKRAITESFKRPEQGKRLFEMSHGYRSIGQ